MYITLSTYSADDIVKTALNAKKEVDKIKGNKAKFGADFVSKIGAKDSAKLAKDALKFKFGKDKLANGLTLLLHGVESANKYLAERYKQTFDKVEKELKELGVELEKRDKSGKELTKTFLAKLSSKLNKIISIAQKDERVYKKFESQFKKWKEDLKQN